MIEIIFGIILVSGLIIVVSFGFYAVFHSMKNIVKNRNRNYYYSKYCYYCKNQECMKCPYYKYVK